MSGNNYDDKLMAFAMYKDFVVDYLNFAAVFSDETLNFVSNNEPNSGEKIIISIRTAVHNVDSVYFCDGEKIYKYTNIRNEGMFDYYDFEILINKTTSYYFKLEKNNAFYYYNKKGIYKDHDNEYNFKLIPDFKVPEWSKGTVIYQIFVDRFYNGDKSNDVCDYEYAYLGKAARHISDWNQPVSTDDVCNFYGGDLQGVIDKLGYLEELGVEVIYFNPLFVSPSNHKYDIQDYDYIDPHYGKIIEDGGEVLSFDSFSNKFASKYNKRTTDKANLEASNELMVELLKKAEERGIKVILDGVFNHCGAFNKWLDKAGFYTQNNYPLGAYKDKRSIYHDYFRWYDDEWPNNDCYDGWWGHDNHPKLNFEASKELYDYIIDIGKKWVSPPYNCAGWRLDVAADLGYTPEMNHKFWKDFRQGVKESNSEAIILAEHYGDPVDWLKGDEWDTVMNYDAFMEPVTWFLTGVEKHSESKNDELFCNAMAFENSMRYFMSRFSIQSLHTAMNELSNHDHSRFLTRTNRKTGRLHTMGSHAADTGINKSIFMEAVVMLMTWPGSPTIYYGDEAGMTGWTDPDNRRTFPWGKEDRVLLELHKKLIKIHKKYTSLQTGSLEYLFNEYGLLSYGRFDKKTSIAVVINNNDYEKSIKMPVWKLNIPLNAKMKIIFKTENDDYSTDDECEECEDCEECEQWLDVISGNIEYNLQKYSSAILLYEHKTN